MDVRALPYLEYSTHLCFDPYMFKATSSSQNAPNENAPIKSWSLLLHHKRCKCPIGWNTSCEGQDCGIYTMVYSGICEQYPEDVTHAISYRKGTIVSTAKCVSVSHSLCCVANMYIPLTDQFLEELVWWLQWKMTHMWFDLLATREKGLKNCVTFLSHKIQCRELM